MEWGGFALKDERLEEVQKLMEGEAELLVEVSDAVRSLEEADSLEELNRARLAILGRKGLANRIFSRIRDAEPSERSRLGKAGNLVKQISEDVVSARESELRMRELEREYVEGAVDITLPGREPPRGKMHILSQVRKEIIEIFISLGYRVVEGPEVEHFYYNFEALNTPAYHPSTSLQDTLYVEGGTGSPERPGEILIRTETSPVQVRVMEAEDPPVYVISPGKCYRRDVSDATHSPMFQQVEGLAVAEGIHMGHLKGTLGAFAKKMFGESRRTRFRPHFFPFTEPSAEVDVSCFLCEGEGCSVCKGSGWLEILGSGMVDPNVLENVGYDSEKYSGYAFGMGIERIAMLKYGIDDIRRFYENDIRFLHQF